MCDLKNTQILSQIETQPMGNTNDVSLNEDEIIWGCLYPIGSAFKPVYLKKDVHSFGRRADCDVSLATIENSLCAVSAYSNLHFTIKRVSHLVGSCCLNSPALIRFIFKQGVYW